MPAPTSTPASHARPGTIHTSDGTAPRNPHISNADTSVTTGGGTRNSSLSMVCLPGHRTRPSGTRRPDISPTEPPAHAGGITGYALPHFSG